MFYVPDADALINLYRGYANAFRQALGNLIDSERLILVKGVYNEVINGTDKLAKFVKKRVNQGRIDVGTITGGPPQLQSYLVSLYQKYWQHVPTGSGSLPGLAYHKRGRKAGDAEVIAFGKCYNATVVSDDRLVQAICQVEGVQWLDSNGWASNLGLCR